MALYPLHQGYGQLATSIFHASSRTKVLRNMQALECVYGLSAAWFLLAPANLWGLGLGATGLACKTVGVQFISVNLYMWLASRFVPLAFWRNLFHQIWSLGLLLGLAFGCRELTLYLGIGNLDSFVRFFCSGVIYTAVLGLVASSARAPWALPPGSARFREAHPPQGTVSFPGSCIAREKGSINLKLLGEPGG